MPLSSRACATPSRSMISSVRFDQQIARLPSERLLFLSMTTLRWPLRARVERGCEPHRPRADDHDWMMRRLRPVLVGGAGMGERDVADVGHVGLRGSSFCRHYQCNGERPSRFASGPCRRHVSDMTPAPRWRDTRQTTRFLVHKRGSSRGVPSCRRRRNERVEGRQPFSRSDVHASERVEPSPAMAWTRGEHAARAPAARTRR